MSGPPVPLGTIGAELDPRLSVADRRFVDAVIRSTTRVISPMGYRPVQPRGGAPAVLVGGAGKVLRRMGTVLTRPVPIPVDARVEGVGHGHPDGDTMLGVRRLRALVSMLLDLHDDGVLGDCLEVGAWRGGAAMVMRAVALVNGEDRGVWLADSFTGYPAGGGRERAEAIYLEANGVFAVSQEEVEDRFARHGLLDAHVHFLKGWLDETLPHAPFDALAMIHIDIDGYEPTRLALEHCYDRLLPGGYVFLEDYGHDGNRRAVDEFRTERREHAAIVELAQSGPAGIVWRKEP